MTQTNENNHTLLIETVGALSQIELASLIGAEEGIFENEDGKILPFSRISGEDAQMYATMNASHLVTTVLGVPDSRTETAETRTNLTLAVINAAQERYDHQQGVQLILQKTANKRNKEMSTIPTSGLLISEAAAAQIAENMSQQGK